ncbi:MAG: DNA polymerase IV, partial [Thermodesulfobacteriota bacterium]|nr:DNA polymerase IV [Thermodesulfobacteriota bacterium]
KAGRYFYDIANGTDLREVNPDRTRKSIGKEITLNKDIDDRTRMVEILGEIAACLEDAMKKHKIKGRTITLKLKYLDFQSITRGVTLNKPVDNARIIHKHITFLLADTNAGIKKVRLLGITISNLATKNPAPGLTQLILPIFQ